MMLSNLKYSWAYFSRNRSYALLNIVGITVSLTCALLIFIYVNFHFSFDRFHEDSERTYRILAVDETTAFRSTGGVHANALIPAIRNRIPEVEDATRFFTSIDGHLGLFGNQYQFRSLNYFSHLGYKLHKVS